MSDIYVRVETIFRGDNYARKLKTLLPAKTHRDARSLASTINEANKYGDDDLCERIAVVVVSVYTSSQGRLYFPIDDLENVARELMQAAKDCENNRADGFLV